MNDAAAEQWARFFEQHGPEVSAQHGYTQAHYDQYLRRGGTRGGPNASGGGVDEDAQTF